MRGVHLQEVSVSGHSTIFCLNSLQNGHLSKDSSYWNQACPSCKSWLHYLNSLQSGRLSKDSSYWSQVRLSFKSWLYCLHSLQSGCLSKNSFYKSWACLSKLKLTILPQLALKQRKILTGHKRLHLHEKKKVDTSKGRFTRYDFCLRLSHAIFVARAARVMKKSYTISTISNLPVATIVVGF